MDNDFILTTVFKFANRVEGQVLHRGTKEECQKLSDFMPAVMTSGEVPESARHLIVAAKDFDLKDGELWRCSLTPDAQRT